MVDELVGLLNSMDTTFRLELRDPNEQNVRRFEARLDQRSAELRAEMAAMKNELKQDIAGLRQEMTEFKAELIKWMFLFWRGPSPPWWGSGVSLSRDSRNEQGNG